MRQEVGAFNMMGLVAEKIEGTMKFAIGTVLRSSLFAVTATVALAQASSAAALPCYEPYVKGPLSHRAKARVISHFCAPYEPRGTVLGPAYGRPGEPLGPGIRDLSIINPRSCGPGLCQNDSHY